MTPRTRLLAPAFAVAVLVALLPATSADAGPNPTTSTTTATSAATSTTSTPTSTTSSTAPTPPAVTVTPSDLLLDGQTVHVEAAGFADGPVHLFECPSSAYDPATCVALASTPTGGALTTDVPLALDVSGTDCSLTVCAVVATSGTATPPQLIAAQHVSFVPFAVDLRIDTSHALPIGPDGHVTVTGTLTCARTATLRVLVALSQGTTYGPPDGGQTLVDCGTQPVRWSVSAGRALATAPPFVPGPASVRGSVIVPDVGGYPGYWGFTGPLPVTLASAAAPVPATPTFTG